MTSVCECSYFKMYVKSYYNNFKLYGNTIFSIINFIMYNKLYFVRESSQVNYSYYISSITIIRDVGEYTSSANNLKTINMWLHLLLVFFLKLLPCVNMHLRFTEPLKDPFKMSDPFCRHWLNSRSRGREVRKNGRNGLLTDLGSIGEPRNKSYRM